METEIYHELLDHFGRDNQLLKAVEECGELICALLHYQNNKVKSEAVVGEIADVAIMLEQLKILFNPDAVEQEIRRKLIRAMPALAARLERQE